MKIHALVLLAFAAPALVRAADQPSAHDLHAAQCVAALEVNTENLAQEVKSGKEASRQLLLDRLVSGTAFVGDVYLHGDSNEQQARDLANKALEAQKSLTPTQLEVRQLACATEGTKLYQSGNALERGLRGEGGEEAHGQIAQLKRARCRKPPFPHVVVK